ncbi:MAG TPA: hypothetical protein VKB25_08905 [Conexibacter sp.]|nr:hypothetical protein [Conexibacter sp.]
MRLRGFPLLLLLALVLCTTASMATASVLAVEAEGPAVTDGRTIAFSPRLGAIRVVTGRSERDVDVEPTCGQAPVQVHAIGAGQVLYRCGGVASPLPQRLDLASGETHAVPGATEVIADNGQATVPMGVSFDGIGAVGVSFATFAYHGEGHGALDWRTGVRVGEPREADRVVDLDQSSLTAALCAPLRKVAANHVIDATFWPLQYRKPFGLVATERLTLRRCGSPRRVVLSHDASSSQLGTRLVAWVEASDSTGRRNRAYAYALACGHRLSWPAASYALVAPLARSVVISESLGYLGPWTIRQVSVRGICRHAVARR